MVSAAGTRQRPGLLRTSVRSNHRHRPRHDLRVAAGHAVAEDADPLPGRRDIRRLPAVAGRDVRSMAGLRRGTGTARLRHRSRDCTVDGRVYGGIWRMVFVHVFVVVVDDVS